MNQKTKKPSRAAMRFFYWFCRPEFREEIEGDLLEQFNTHYINHGHKRANRLFIKEVILLFRPSIIGNINHLTNTSIMEIINQNKRLIMLLCGATAILCIPLIAMNFSNEVNWTILDFVVMGGLLFGTGLVLELVQRKVKNQKSRILLGAAVIIMLFLVWTELSVGIFGSPFAGS